MPTLRPRFVAQGSVQNKAKLRRAASLGISTVGVKSRVFTPKRIVGGFTGTFTGPTFQKASTGLVAFEKGVLTGIGSVDELSRRTGISLFDASGRFLTGEARERKIRQAVSKINEGRPQPTTPSRTLPAGIILGESKGPGIATITGTGRSTADIARAVASKRLKTNGSLKQPSIQPADTSSVVEAQTESAVGRAFRQFGEFFNRFVAIPGLPPPGSFQRVQTEVVEKSIRKGFQEAGLVSTANTPKETNVQTIPGSDPVIESTRRADNGEGESETLFEKFTGSSTGFKIGDQFASLAVVGVIAFGVLQILPVVTGFFKK